MNAFEYGFADELEKIAISPQRIAAHKDELRRVSAKLRRGVDADTQQRGVEEASARMRRKNTLKNKEILRNILV